MQNTIDELDVVELRHNVSDMPAGSKGTVLLVLTKPHSAYLVEFTDSDGVTIAEVTLTEDQIELVWKHKPSSGESSAVSRSQVRGCTSARATASLGLSCAATACTSFSYKPNKNATRCASVLNFGLGFIAST